VPPVHALSRMSVLRIDTAVWKTCPARTAGLMNSFWLHPAARAVLQPDRLLPGPVAGQSAGILPAGECQNCDLPPLQCRETECVIPGLTLPVPLTPAASSNSRCASGTGAPESIHCLMAVFQRCMGFMTHHTCCAEFENTTELAATASGCGGRTGFLSRRI
jgi:hypothetical protein